MSKHCDLSQANPIHTLTCVAKTLRQLKQPFEASLTYWQYTLRAKCESGELPCENVGGRIKVSDSELRLWLAVLPFKMQCGHKVSALVEGGPEVEAISKETDKEPSNDKPTPRCRHDELGYSPLHTLSVIADLFGVSRDAVVKRSRGDLKKSERLRETLPTIVLDGSRSWVYVSDAQLRHWLALHARSPLFNDYKGPRPEIPSENVFRLSCGHVFERVPTDVTSETGSSGVRFSPRTGARS